MCVLKIIIGTQKNSYEVSTKILGGKKLLSGLFADHLAPVSEVFIGFVTYWINSPFFCIVLFYLINCIVKESPERWEQTQNDIKSCRSIQWLHN